MTIFLATGLSGFGPGGRSKGESIRVREVRSETDHSLANAKPRGS